MSESVYIHLDLNLHPDWRIEGIGLAGEGMWAKPVGNPHDGLYRIDNLLSTTFTIGFKDVVRCKDQGTEWGEREVFELAEPYECWRFILACKSNAPIGPDESEATFYSAAVLQETLTARFGENAYVSEGGMGLLMVQTEPDLGDEFANFLELIRVPFMAAGITMEENA